MRIDDNNFFDTFLVVLELTREEWDNIRMKEQMGKMQ